MLRAKRDLAEEEMRRRRQARARRAAAAAAAGRASAAARRSRRRPRSPSRHLEKSLGSREGARARSGAPRRGRGGPSWRLRLCASCPRRRFLPRGPLLRASRLSPPPPPPQQQQPQPPPWSSRSSLQQTLPSPRRRRRLLGPRGGGRGPPGTRSGPREGTEQRRREKEKSTTATPSSRLPLRSCPRTTAAARSGCTEGGAGAGAVPEGRQSR